MIRVRGKPSDELSTLPFRGILGTVDTIKLDPVSTFNHARRNTVLVAPPDEIIKAITRVLPGFYEVDQISHEWYLGQPFLFSEAISMPVVRFIGDIHSRFEHYTPIIDDCNTSIQVGDFGMGFAPPPTEAMMKGDHWFLRGNHDSPTLCQEHPRWIKDGTMHNGVFCVGGARSRDMDTRTPGLDWWHDEELTIGQFWDVINDYEAAKPDVVATHDCPEAVVNILFGRDSREQSRTRQALDTMFEIHRPKLWLFGHWHRTTTKTILGTTFMCLGINHHVDVLVTPP
jgi:hypothetical protein